MASEAAIPEVLDRLLRAPGPSGYERAAAEVFRAAATSFSEVGGDTVGSSTARVAGTGGGPSMAVIGHIDEIGLIVKHIDDEGFLWFAGVGGWDPAVICGQRIALHTRAGEIPGVVGRRPPHLIKPDDRKKMPELDDLHIDIGAKDGADARARVRIGDVAVVAVEPVEFPHGRLVSRALDNRLGCFVAFEVARLVAERGGAPGDLVAVAATQEETTYAGAYTTAFSLEPDVAIVVDVTFASDAPGMEPKEVGRSAFGSGPVIARGSTLSPRVFELLYETAEQESIPFTVEATVDKTWTDADAVHVARAGIPTGLVSIPLRYMHSPVEMVDLADVHAAAKLIAAFAARLTDDISFVR